jgi:hypothetical protein
MTTATITECEMDWTATTHGLMDSPCGEPATTEVQIEGATYKACRSCATWLANHPPESTAIVDILDPSGGDPSLFWSDPRSGNPWRAYPGRVEDDQGNLRDTAEVYQTALVMLAVCAESDRLVNKAAVSGHTL